MFNGMTDQQVYVLYGIVIFLVAAPVLITAASLAGILGRMAATRSDESRPGRPT